MNLHILDSSNYIYQGAAFNKMIARGVREDSGSYRANDAPIGGVKFLIDRVCDLLSPENKVVIAFDKLPTVKREMYTNCFGVSGYKATRQHRNSSIYAQRYYAEQILRDMDFPVLSVDGYEADDIIYSFVKYYAADYEHVYVHTRDSDLSFLVSENVSIDKVGTQGKYIDLYNYRTEALSNYELTYNLVMVVKLMIGDTSDNIPGVGTWVGEALDTIYGAEDYRKCGDLDVCRNMLREVAKKFPDKPKSHNLVMVFNLRAPLLVPLENIELYDEDYDADKLKYYTHNWNKDYDHWHLEDMLLEYIDSYNQE